MMRALRGSAKFAIVLIAMTAMFSLLWSRLITDALYNCTAAVGLDYLHPGDWVHGQVKIVDGIVPGRSMSEPDTIKKGWSVTGLWGLWITFAAISLLASFMLARAAWLPAWNAEPGAAREPGPALCVMSFGNSRISFAFHPRGRAGSVR